MNFLQKLREYWLYYRYGIRTIKLNIVVQCTYCGILSRNGIVVKDHDEDCTVMRLERNAR